MSQDVKNVSELVDTLGAKITLKPCKISHNSIKNTTKNVSSSGADRADLTITKETGHNLMFAMIFVENDFVCHTLLNEQELKSDSFLFGTHES